MSDKWVTSTDSSIIKTVKNRTDTTLLNYQNDHMQIQEHYGHELGTKNSGYARGQLFELIQNGADALIKANETGPIQIVLTSDTLYCANKGKGIEDTGVTSLLMAYLSDKTHNQIGRFGLGFKSILGLGDYAEFYSRPGSFKFDKEGNNMKTK